ncbi:MAG: PDZ domain-containing protein [Nitrospirae bacterium]|nr:PDZ domain-containing protein [Nitrospirota bacterium]
MFEFSFKKLYLLNYFLGALILIASLLLVRSIVSTTLSKKQPRPAASESKMAVQKAASKKPLMYYSPILEKNPFGPPMTLSPIEVSEENAAQPSPLSNLILVGTVVGPKNLSYAIFEDKVQSPGKQEVFRYGTEVFNYGTLIKIEKSSIEIEQNSVISAIPLQDLPSASASAPEQSTESQRPSFAKKVGEKEYILDSRRVQQSLENPEKILTEARLLPNIKDGKQSGFKISEVVPGGIYQSLGLRNGDILLRINGLEISNAEVAMQAMTALKGMNSVNLDIIRNDQNMSMTYRIR